MGMPFATNEELQILEKDLKTKIAFTNIFKDIHKVSDYLYEVEYTELDYDFARCWFKKHNIALKPTACTSVRNGRWYGRNFDWFYNHDCDFVIRTSGLGKIPSIGVAGSVSSLNKDIMEKGGDKEYFKLLPFFTLDGVNQAGVFVNSNVVPQDFGRVIKTECTEKVEYEMFLLMWPRFVLDKFTNATEAVEYTKKHISFFQTEFAGKYHYDIHFMIGDAEHTYVVEIMNNKVEYREFNIMANFHVVPTQFNSDLTVYTPNNQDSTHNAIDTNKISEHGSGLERHNIAVANINNINTKEDMVNLMHNLLNYNNSYRSDINPIWYTEFVGQTDTYNYTVKTDKEIYDQKVMPIVVERFNNRNRDDNPQPIWHTTHTSVYDLEDKVLYIYDSTEDGIEHKFRFNKYYTAEEIDNLIESLKLHNS